MSHVRETAETEADAPVVVVRAGPADPEADFALAARVVPAVKAVPEAHAPLEASVPEALAPRVDPEGRVANAQAAASVLEGPGVAPIFVAHVPAEVQDPQLREAKPQV